MGPSHRRAHRPHEPTGAFFTRLTGCTGLSSQTPQWWWPCSMEQCRARVVLHCNTVHCCGFASLVVASRSDASDACGQKVTTSGPGHSPKQCNPCIARVVAKRPQPKRCNQCLGLEPLPFYPDGPHNRRVSQCLRLSLNKPRALLQGRPQAPQLPSAARVVLQ